MSRNSVSLTEAEQTAFAVFLMPKTKAQKAEIIDKIAEKINKAKILVFTSFNQRGRKGLDFPTMEKLKKNLKKIGAEYAVLKKTMLKLALDKTSLGNEAKVDEMQGSVAVMFGYQDMVEPLKVLHKLSKENEALLFYSGLNLDNRKIISKDLLVELANLPSREVLLAKAVWAIRSPLSGLANVLQGNIRGLAVALSQIKK
ncbi:MAG: 50S ribosomal protein L10 [Patescibacteria group bacterium]